MEEIKLVYCPACGRSFGKYKDFKTHLSATNYFNKRNKHYDLRGKYFYIPRINEDSPLYEKPNL